MKVDIKAVGFEDEDLQITWIDTDAMGEHGGSIYLSTITEAAQDDDQQVKYWATELRQAVDELLGAWLILTRKMARSE